MNRANTIISPTHTFNVMPLINKRTALLVAAALLAFLLPATAHAGQAGGELQQKMAAVKESVAANQQRLHQYQWTETTQLTLNGDAKPPTQSMCQYGPGWNGAKDSPRAAAGPA